MEGTYAKNGIQLFVSFLSFEVGEDFHRVGHWVTVTLLSIRINHTKIRE